jgi:Fe-S oxidoreductase
MEQETMLKISPDFAKSMRLSDTFNANACIHCGTCTALCPIGLSALPRTVFRYALLGLEENIIDNTDTIFTCLLCRMCEDKCPADVKIAENIRTLRTYVNRDVFEGGQARPASAAIRSILGILNDNIDRRHSALPLSTSTRTRWAKGLNIPRGGETVLYTGQMYQLIPAIQVMAASLSRFENSWVTRFFGLGRAINKLINVSRFIARPPRSEQDRYDNMIRNIALLLQSASVAFGYLYEEDLYAGALAYDQGLDQVFQKQARLVAGILKRRGVKRVITVDPHTTDMLRTAYPKVMDDFDVEVKSYLEVLAEETPEVFHKADADVVIHDSCVYARHQGIVDEPRMLLNNAGYRIQEIEYSGKETHCCGGPIESLFPGKAHEIAVERVQQLAASGCPVVTMCPICLVNLKSASAKNGPEIEDISAYLAPFYCAVESAATGARLGRPPLRAPGVRVGV